MSPGTQAPRLGSVHDSSSHPCRLRPKNLSPSVEGPALASSPSWPYPLCFLSLDLTQLAAQPAWVQHSLSHFGTLSGDGAWWKGHRSQSLAFQNHLLLWRIWSRFMDSHTPVRQFSFLALKCSCFWCEVRQLLYAAQENTLAKET